MTSIKIQKKQEKYNIIYTKEEIISRIQEIESFENWILYKKVESGEKLEEERLKLYGLIQ